MDPKKLVEGVEALLKFLFGEQVPPAVTSAVGVLLLVSIAVLFLYGILIGFGKAAKVFREDVRPTFYDDAERRRAEKRRRFADHIESEIRRIDNAEEWRDYKFAELEAEVEIEGRRRGFLRWRSAGLRREKSLSRALRNSRERLVLLEGEPGSGKSVALRYVASQLARAAMKSRNADAVIPLYVNLKSIEREPGQKIDATLIEAHVLRTLGRPNTRDIHEFLEQEFRRGLEEGTWLFLFDSFDEIPEILSVTSAETVIRDYGTAIEDFLGGLNRCRGIIASRYFRGPGGLVWPRFRILALSDRYRRNLLRQADLEPHVERDLIGEIESGQPEFADLSRNPLFLGLLCEYMRHGNPFPENPHVVFESYVSSRLERDREKLRLRFGADAAAVRAGAERAAFCMAASPGLGLSPARPQLAAAMSEGGFDGDPQAILDALEYIKLARGDEHDRVRTFTFAHRRFQEYFATCVVIREPGVVPPETLLTDARWRETAVVLLQTQQDVGELLAVAETQLRGIVEQIDGMFPDVPPLETIEGGNAARPRPVLFPWPPLTLHLLGLLQSAFRGRPERVPEEIRQLAGRIALTVNWTGSLADRRWLIEVAGIAPHPVLSFALSDAYASGSAWLGDAAYRQAGALRSMPEDIAAEIRLALVKSFLNGALQRQKHATYAYLARLPDPKPLLAVLRLLLAIRPADGALFAAVALFGIWTGAGALAVAGLIVGFIAPYAVARAAGVNWPFIQAFYMVTVRIAATVWCVDRAPDPVIPLVFAASTWSIMAVFAARTGQFVHPAWWPLYPFYPLLYLVSYRGIRSLRRVTERARTAAPPYMVGGVLLGGLFVMSNYFPRAGSVVSTVLGTFILIAIAAAVVLGVRDIFRLRLYKRRPAPWTVEELLRLLHSLTFATSRLRLVRWLRQKAMLAPTEESEYLLRSYAVQLEPVTRARGDANEIALLDELHRLAEQLRAGGP